VLCCVGCRAPAEPSVPAASDPRPSSTTTPAKVENAAPDFTLRTLDGGTFTLSDHRGKLPVVLNFWAPW
jgi:hypothetical protein